MLFRSRALPAGLRRVPLVLGCLWIAKIALTVVGDGLRAQVEWAGVLSTLGRERSAGSIVFFAIWGAGFVLLGRSFRLPPVSGAPAKSA